VQEAESQSAARVAPHRGAAVLTLGILGFVCFICGIIGWAMGSADLRAMRDGRMDRSGQQMTSAGHICGIVSTLLGVVGLLFYLAFAAFFVTHHDDFRSKQNEMRRWVEESRPR
jgi:hypothetical protein